MRVLQLGEAELAALTALQIRRWPLPEDPLEEHNGGYFLWPRCAQARRLYSVVLSRVFYQENLPWQRAQNDKLFVRLDPVQAQRFRAAWRSLPRVIVVEDDLRFTAALDLTRPTPEDERTQVGELVYQAKYQGSEQALRELCDRAASAAARLEVFAFVDQVAPVPSSRMQGGNRIPQRVAQAVAEELGARYAPDLLRPIVDRPSLKNQALADKATLLQGTIAASGVLPGTVLLVDDHYQSGTTLNYLARGLRSLGAVTVYGLACDKTLSNRDNTSAAAD